MPENHQKKDTTWAMICEMYGDAKALALYAEEIDIGFNTFLQPTRETSQAFDHLVRAKSYEYGVGHDPQSKEVDPSYITDALDKTLGHVYRAFFDSADWMALCLRERIREDLENYSRECITAVLPDYYSEMRPRIDEISKNIAKFREEKDVSDKDKMIEQVRNYYAAVNELTKSCEKVRSSVPALDEYSAKETKENNAATHHGIKVGLLIGLFCTLVGVLLTWFLAS